MIPVSREQFYPFYFAHALHVTDTDRESVAVTNDVHENEKHFGWQQSFSSPAKLIAVHQTICEQKAVTLERRESLTKFLFWHFLGKSCFGEVCPRCCIWMDTESNIFRSNGLFSKRIFSESAHLKTIFKKKYFFLKVYFFQTVFSKCQDFQLAIFLS